MPSFLSKKDIGAIILLLLASIFIKVFFLLFYSGCCTVNLFDIDFYHKTWLQITSGHLPYIAFGVDYPQLYLIPVLIAGTLSETVYGNFSVVFVIMTFLLDMIVIISIYLIAVRLKNRRTAIIASLMYMTAMGSQYFVMTKYDIFPVALMMVSLTCALYGRDAGAYVWATLGGLAKWFPGLLLPFYIIYGIKNRITGIRKFVLVSVVITAFVMLPFLVISPVNFIYTYTVNTNFNTLAGGFIFYLNYIAGTTMFSDISMIIVAALIIGLIWWYYKYGDKDYNTMLIIVTAALFIFVIFNKVQSPQYWLWLTPLYVIFLSDSIQDAAAFYAFQIVLFLEYPWFFNVIYDNTQGYYGITAVEFFTIKFVIAFIIIFLILRKMPKASQL